MSLLCQLQPFMMVPAASLLISMLHLYTPVLGGSFILLIISSSKYLKKKSELRNRQFCIFEKIKSQRTTSFRYFKKFRIKASSIYSKNLKEPLGFMKEPADLWVGIFTFFMKIWLYSRAQYGHIKTNTYLTNLPNHGIPWSAFGNAEQSSTSKCALL